ncbi:scamp-domain-containing protein [Punctularia strigosozonata HHB-11173 SS5]|uniref:scamp-domain-containing protein n=1 Tax=Punctularia strigosozonata (strain HHB-11173) TaxID=741275 RepID=UPI00044178AA|nr:scamp-domain-containing protein [Punctularia strigosozonata HHB-11173 SS5]EIN07304.1 scamp-domain-containing protein [Punctularia strigosozonata HHB-11173 SS5]
MSELTQNPFASTHSLDANPFEDPPDAQSARAAELERRERELERREQELTQKADHIRRHGRNNFPPFFPLVYHDINEEIPEASRPLITRLFQLWLVLAATLIINMIACIFVLVGGGSDGVRDLISGIIYVPVIGLLSFLLWYRPIYNGYMKEQSLYYYLYFFFGGWHLLFSLYMAIGIPSTGSAGLINTIQMFIKHSWVAAILGLIASIGWIVQGLGNAFYYRQIWAHHNAAGHSMEKAKSELAMHGAKSYFTRG